MHAALKKGDVALRILHNGQMAFVAVSPDTGTSDNNNGSTGSDNDGSGSGDDRRRGWAEAMAERLGLAEPELDALTARCEDRVGDALAAAEPLLRRDASALVCASDSLATGSIAAAAQRSVRLPVIGFDNTALAEGLSFPSVDQDLGAVAAAALTALDAPTGAVTTIVRPHLVRRDGARWGITPAADRGPSPS